MLVLNTTKKNHLFGFSKQNLSDFENNLPASDSREATQY